MACHFKVVHFYTKLDQRAIRQGMSGLQKRFQAFKHLEQALQEVGCSRIDW